MNWKKLNHPAVYFILFVIFVSIITTGYMLIGGYYKAFKIPSDGMKNTLLRGEHIIADMSAYDDAGPQYNDLMIFYWPGDKQTNYIQRCVGLPGDKIEVVDGVLLVNDTEFVFNEIYDRPASEPKNGNSHNYGPFVIPDDYYFAMGDNFYNSYDSRYWGPVHRDLLRGKAIRIYWSGSRDRFWMKLY